MMGTLLRIRFRAMLAGITALARKKGQKRTGMVILFAVLYLYIFGFIAFAMALGFYTLAGPYHAAGHDWLYFSTAALMSLGFSLMGNVFTTQSQLYEARDNNLLLSMPIKPKHILLSRMASLMALSALFSSLVMVPAIVVYALVVGSTLPQILLQLLGLAGIVVFSQTLACLLGWLLHLLLRRVHKSFASMLYMILFLGFYFWLYSQAGNILNAMVANSDAIAGAISTWVWPLFALGRGCTGSIVHGAVLPGIAAVFFWIVYRILARTFIATATSGQKERRRSRLDLGRIRPRSPLRAIMGKEAKKFLATPVYLTNMGMGILMTAGIAVAGVLLRHHITPLFESGILSSDWACVLICAVLTFVISTMCVATPSVSLEGPNIWVLKSMPVSGKTILTAKLGFHCCLTVPVSSLAGLVLSLALECGPVQVLLCGLYPGCLALFSGLFGMIAGLQWARLDYISEAQPCKQSLSILVSMFGVMLMPVLLSLPLLPLMLFVDVTVYLACLILIIGGLCFGLYKLLCEWGVRKWEELS